MSTHYSYVFVVSLKNAPISPFARQRRKKTSKIFVCSKNGLKILLYYVVDSETNNALRIEEFVIKLDKMMHSRENEIKTIESQFTYSCAVHSRSEISLAVPSKVLKVLKYEYTRSRCKWNLTTESDAWNCGSLAGWIGWAYDSKTVTHYRRHSCRSCDAVARPIKLAANSVISVSRPCWPRPLDRRCWLHLQDGNSFIFRQCDWSNICFTFEHGILVHWFGLETNVPCCQNESERGENACIYASWNLLQDINKLIADWFVCSAHHTYR